MFNHKVSNAYCQLLFKLWTLLRKNPSNYGHCHVPSQSVILSLRTRSHLLSSLAYQPSVRTLLATMQYHLYVLDVVRHFEVNLKALSLIIRLLHSK